MSIINRNRETMAKLTPLKFNGPRSVSISLDKACVTVLAERRYVLLESQ